MDIIYHGTEDEKNEVSFMLLDVRGEGMIILDSFEKFWVQFLQMYCDLLHTKIKYDEAMKGFTESLFMEIAKISERQGGKEKRKVFKIRKMDENRNFYFVTEERTYFDFNDFKLARSLDRDMFAWLDQPEQYVQEFLNMNKKEAMITLDEFKEYHEQVKMTINELTQQLDYITQSRQQSEAVTLEQAMQLAPSTSMVSGVPLMGKIASSNAKNLCTISKMTKNMSVM